MNEAVSERDPAQVARFVERFASDLAEAGFARMPARVFAALLASDEARLSAAELAERLQISPAAVSGAVRYLIQINLASRESEPGSRRDFYRVHDEVWYESISRRDGMMKRLESSLGDGVLALGPGTPAGDRMAETLDFFEFIREELPKLVDRWRIERAARTAGRNSVDTR